MYKDVLRQIEGVGIYPVISFIIFFVFFIALFVYVFAMKKKDVDELKQIPLDDDVEQNELTKNGIITG